MTDEQLLRYSRHIMLPEVGIEGQTALLASHALVIGAGGLGSPVALYLGSAGVGHITLVDHDVVDASNLQRQIAHTLARIGTNKAESAAIAISAINPDVNCTALARRADAALLDQLVPSANVVLDCTDNFTIRHTINAACVRHRIPLVSGAAIQMDAQVSVFDARDESSPCYACAFSPSLPPPDALCATMGVLAPLVGIVGSLMAAQAIQMLTSGNAALEARLALLDARTMTWETMGVKRNLNCPVCGQLADRTAF